MSNDLQTNTAVIKQKRFFAKRKNATAFFLDNIVWLLLLISLIVMGLINPVFFTRQILGNILVQSSILGVLAAGLSFAILIGEIDLSIVGITAFAAACGTMLMKAGLNWILAILVMVLIGILIGTLNGVLVAKLKAVSLIETLAVQIALLGAVMAMTQGRSIVNFSDAYKFVGQGSVFGFPVLPIIFILVYIVVNLVWKRTTFGRSLFAVGGNASSAHVSGIKVDRIKIYAFLVSGGLAGFSGFLLSSYMGAVTSTFGTEYIMYSIAAAVIGGISLSGGRGKISGVLGGVLLLTVIQIGLQILGISSYFVQLSGGMMIFVAVIIDAIRLKLQG